MMLSAIHGTVRIAGAGPPAAGIHVAVDGRERTTTDSAGRYRVEALAPGRHDLTFSGAGLRTRRITLFLGDSADQKLDLALTPSPTILPAIEVVADLPTGLVPTLGRDGPSWREGGRFELGRHWQDSQLAGETDVLQALARLPGITTRGDNALDLSIRGGRGSENLVLLDGIPLAGAVHFGGASSAISPDAIARIDLHTGVSSVRHAGALAGVIEMRTVDTRPADVEVTGGLSSTDLRSMVRAPIGRRGSLLLGARTTYRDLFTDATGLGRANGYHDLLGTAGLALGNGVLHVVGFQSGNRLHWGLPAEQDGSAEDDVAVNGADWQSAAAGASWSAVTAGGVAWQTTAWWSGTTVTMTAGDGVAADELRSTLAHTGARAERHQRLGEGALLLGAEVGALRTRYRVRSSDPAAPTLDLLRDPVVGSVFAEWDWDGAGRLAARSGLRASSDFRGTVFLDPRLLVHLRVGPATRLEAGFGRAHQVVQSMLNEENVGSAILGPSLPLARAPGEPVARADEWSLDLQHRLGTHVTLAIDAYRRDWHAVLTPATTTSGLFAREPARGDGHAEGVLATLALEGARVGLTTTLGVAAATQRSGGVSYRTGSARPWQVSGDARWRPAPATLLQLGWSTGAGQARTPIAAGVEWQPYQPGTGTGEIEGSPTTLPGAVNAVRVPGPIRIDVGGRRDWTLRHGPHPALVSTAVRVQNLLNRTNAVGVMALADGSFQWLRSAGRAVVLELGWRF